MPTKDFIVKLAADSKGYQSGMSEASKALDKFQKQNLSTSAAIKTVTSTLSKYLSVAALAKGAVDAFTATMRGSQTTSDKFDASMRAAKTTVNNFFSSLSTGDFTQFNMGLDAMITKAKEAYAALDRLGNASMSWGYFQTARMADLTDLQAIVGDKSLPVAQRQQAATQMKAIRDELQGYAAGYEQRAIEAMARVMTESTNLEWTDVTRDDLEKVLSLDLISKSASESEKQRLAARYQQYLAEVQRITDDYNKNDRKFASRIVGTTPTGAPQYAQVDVTPEADRALYAQDLRDVAREYQDAILYNQALVRGSDEWLQNLIQLVQQADAAERSMRRVNSAVQQADNSLTTTTSTGDVPKFNTSLSTLPAMSGLMAEPMMDYQTKLPEINTGLQNINGSLVKMSGNLSDVQGRFNGLNDGGRALESIGRSMEQLAESDGWKGVGGIVSGVGSAVQAYMQLATAAQTAAAAQAATETPTVWGKIAAITALVSAFASTAAQLKSMSNYAEGGVVPGRNWNDGITARVSSGEMFINEADQKRLYDSIHSGNLGGGGGGPAVVTGEQIVLAVNNYGRRTNQGELVFGGR